MSWLAVRWTPAAIDSSATISPTPIATPAEVSAVRPFRRMRFFQTSPGQVTCGIVAARLGPMGATREQVYEALSRVIDPELRKPVTELDMVRDISINGGSVEITIALTVAGCPLRSSFQDQVAEHVAPLPGVESVALEFDVMSPDEKAALSAKLRGGVSERTKGIALDKDT